MASFDFNQGRAHALNMLEGMATKTIEEVRAVLDNLEKGSKRKPAQYGAGIMAVVDLARQAIEKR